jgi:Holliday junction resolvase-like predicted endonuclease
LFQAWYLTIEEKIITEDRDILYKLRLPNKEVKSSLFKFLIDYFTNDFQVEIKRWISLSLKKWDINWFIQELKILFSSLPYNNYVNNEINKYEWYYASLVYAYLQSLGYEIIWEDVTNRWRIDLTIKTEDKIYILEFKMKMNTQETPLKQIEEKKYYEKYLWENKDIYLVWIIFDKEEKNISEWESKEVVSNK